MSEDVIGLEPRSAPATGPALPPVSTPTPSPAAAAPRLPTLRELLAPGLAALKAHWPQFVLFQATALAIVIGYFKVDAVHQACESLSALKQQYGLLFAAVAMVIAGLFLPELAKIALGSRNRVKWAEYPSTIAFFIGGAMIVDLQYRLLGVLLGEDPTFATAVKKMLADQFIATPIYGTVYWLLVFAWRANGYRLKPTLGAICPRWYYCTVVPLLLPAWCFWIPMTLMIYSLPAGLQFTLFSLAMAAWSLIMISVARHSEPKADLQAQVNGWNGD